VPPRSQVGLATAQVRVLVRLARPPRRPHLAAQLARRRIEDDELRHFFEPLVRRVGELDEAEHRESVVVAAEDVQVELGTPVAPRQQTVVEEGEPVVVAGGENDEIDALGRAVDKDDGILGKAGDVRPGDQVAMTEMVQHLRVHDRVTRKQLVVGLRQTVAGQVADELVEKLRLIGRQAHAGRWRHDAGEQRIGWYAADVLRNVPVAAAYGEVSPRREQRGIARDVDTRVAAADDQHAPAAKLRRIAIRGRVADLAPELIHAVIGRHVRMPVHAGRGDDPGVPPRLAGGERDVPRFDRARR
jgi:hypothetical protein